MYRLIPHFIQENLSRGNLQGEFLAVGLFVDVSGFSAMTETLLKQGLQGAEILAEVMQGVFDPLAEVVYAHGGMLINMAGDAFTALFPYKGETEALPACEHALAAAWFMQNKEACNHDQVTPFGVFSIQLKIGLALGSVGWGILISDDRCRAAYYFQGAAVDGCAEVEHHANACEILMDEALYGLCLDRVGVDPVAENYRLTALKFTLPAAQEFSLPDEISGVLQSFFPPIVAERSHRGEFRQVVNLFINLPTVRSQSQLVIFVQNIFDLLDRYGGVFKRIDFGDKGSHLYLFWGAPVGYEDDVERALNFLVDLQSLTSIPIHAGVTYQTAYAGFLRTPHLEEYTCFGWAVNLAARFMMAAPRGEIWIDEPVARRARELFETQHLGQRSFKGFAHPQQVYLLEEKRTQVQPFYSGEMVCRESELSELSEFIEPIQHGRYAGALVIWGEAGMGKSRLVHEFQFSQQLAGSNILWALCQSDKILREPLNPFRYWLMRFFDQSVNQTEARNKRNFNRILDQLIQVTQVQAPGLCEELDRTRSFLGELVSLSWTDSLYAQLDPQGRYENTQIGLVSLLKALSAQQPVILFIEDVQWLDEDSSLFLPYLNRSFIAEAGRSYPVALIATSRHESQAPVLGEGLEYAEINLAEISPEGVQRLAEDQLKAQVAPPLVQLLVERAQGNPFFAGQILQFMRDESLVGESSLGWDLNGEAVEAALPIDVGALLAARLDRLDHDMRNIVQAASVIGREFEIPLLEKVSSAAVDMSENVRRIVQADIWARLDELHCIFRHILLREVAYSMLLHSQRRKIHAAVVLGMELLYAQDLDLHYGELAFHSREAGLLEKACTYLTQAGNSARDTYHNALAANYYQQALELIPESAVRKSTSDEQRFKVLLEHEAVVELLGWPEEQRQDLEQLTGLAIQLDQDQAGHLPETKRRWGNYYLRNGEYDQAIEQSEDAFQLAEVEKNSVIMVEALLTLANANQRKARFEIAIQQAQRALDLSCQAGDLPRQGEAWNMLGLIALEIEEPEKVYRYFEEGLRIAQETGKLWVEARVWNNLGNLAGMQGNFSQAQEYYQKALDLARVIGNRRGEGLVLGNMGWIAGMLGDYPQARTFCEQNLRIAIEAGDQETLAFNYVNLCSICERQGDYQAAQAFGEQALELARQSGDRSAQAWADLFTGHVWVGLSQPGLAFVHYQHGLEIREELSQANLACELRAGLALALLENGRSEEAIEQVRSILQYFDSGGTLDGADEPMRVYLSCILGLESIEDPRAQSLLKTAYQAIQERASKITSEPGRRSFLEKVPYHQEIIRKWEQQPGL